MQTKPQNKALIVLGMHRSGTSAVAGALRCLGVPLGRRLYSGHAGINPKGYFEHRDLADTHQEALLAMGSDWDDLMPRADGWWDDPRLERYADAVQAAIRRDFSGTPLWAVKDPRVCRLLPWWLQVLERERIAPVFVIVVRSPAAVGQSLARRDGFGSDKSLLLWLLHYLEAERWTQGRSRVFIEYETFLQDPAEALAVLEPDLGIRFPVGPVAAGDCLRRFVSAHLNHHAAEALPDAAASTAALAADLHRLLAERARHSDGAVPAGDIDDVRRRFDAICTAFPDALVEHLGVLGARRGETGLFVHRVMRSWSWYLGKPVRFVERLFGRDV